MNQLSAQFINTFDDLLEVDYKELIHQFFMSIVTIVAVIVAVTVWIANRIITWYRNGGEELIANLYQTSTKVIVTYVPKFVKFIIETKKVIHREFIQLGIMIPA